LDTSVRHFEDQADGCRQSFPTRGFGFELGSAFAGEAIKLCLATSVGVLPIRSEEPAVFEPVQCGVERPLGNLDNVARNLLQALRYGVPMYGAERDNFQDQKV
jgi:hypothetical protein